jgi:hypothetical protein
MHIEILSPAQKKILPLLKSFKPDFYLAGGTAIALLLNHRKSIDFDLFTAAPIKPQALENALIRAGYRVTQTLVTTIDEYTIIVAGVKLSFISYPFPIVAEENWEDIGKLPNLLTLAAMKAYTLGRRAKWKDYVDLYFLIRDHFSVSTISAEAERIFGGGFNSRAFREQLAYFEGIDYSEQVEFVKNNQIDNAEIRKFLIDAAVK